MLHWLPHTHKAEQRDQSTDAKILERNSPIVGQNKTDIFGQIKLWEKGNIISNDKLYIQ